MSTVFTCERPVKIRNRYSGEIQYVPCHKCNVCLSRRAQKWTHRLNDEAKCHPYQIFSTLTYAPENLPLAKFDKLARYRSDSSLSISFQAVDGTFLIPFDDVKYHLDTDSLDYIRLNNNYLPYARISDVQKFIKRLRARVSNQRGVKSGLWNNSGEPLQCRYVRYFAVSEYGETCLRPHFHLIIYTGSKWFAENQKAVISACWSIGDNAADPRELGFVDSQLVKSSCASYVASYLNSVSSLPKIYSFSQFRPRSFSSKCPPIGSLFSSSEEIQNLFSSGSVTRSVRTKDSGVLQVPLEQDFCNRLYPRVQGFDRLPEHLCRRIYSTGFQWSFLGREERFNRANDLSREKSELGEYFKKLVIQDSNSVAHSTLNNFFSVLSRFSIQSSIFNISPEDYYEKIVSFWKRRDYELLRIQCEWQDEKSHSGLDSNFVFLSVDGVHCDGVRDAVIKNRLSNLNLSAYDTDTLTYSVNLSPDHDPDWVDKVSLSRKVITDGKNKHRKFEYLNSGKLNDLLSEYHKKRLINNF